MPADRFKQNDHSAERRRKETLWETLHEFARERGASITSVRYAWPARLECASADGKAPTELRLATVFLNGRKFGFSVHHCTEAETGGLVERIAPIGAIETIAGARSSAPALRKVAHAQVAPVASFDITTQTL